MAPTTSKPGPLPTSCLTCRRRRKKCDLSRPRCERCLKGGYECLGYEDHIKPRARVDRKDPTTLISSQVWPIPPASPVGAARLETLDSDPAVGCSEDRQDLTETNNGRGPKRSILAAALEHRMRGLTSSAKADSTVLIPSEEPDCLWPQEKGLIVHLGSPVRRFSDIRAPFNATSGMGPRSSDLNGIITALCRAVPLTVDATQITREGYFLHVLHDYYSQRINFWFTTPSFSLRDTIVALVTRSKKMTWTIYLGAKLFQAPTQDPSGAMIQECVGWIDKLHEKFTTDSRRNPPPSDIAERFMVQLELAFFKFTAVDCSSGYKLLQKALPRFLQLVADDTDVQMEHPNGNLVVSFLRTLHGPRYELSRFVIYDTVTSLVLAVPPLLEYGYDGECEISSHRLESIYGIPSGLLQVISEASSWRASSRDPLDNWQTLEARVLTWQPPYATQDNVMTAADISTTRTAVQEGWRYVVLIYVYMGICGVSSHDPRVQASVHRLIQLVETVENLPIGVQVLAHCIVAGLAARLEKDRVLVHRMLLSFKDIRVWLFKGPQFSHVLHHLWHGVGEGGAAVTWDDYMRSRCAVMPI